MRTVIRMTLLLCLLCGTAQAMPAMAGDHQIGDLQRVDRIRVMRNIDGWRPLDSDSVIIWATPFKPYLVVLARKAHDLRFANVIGVTSTAGTVYDRFDSVVVNGWRYPIAAIYELDRDTARHLKAT